MQTQTSTLDAALDDFYTQWAARNVAAGRAQMADIDTLKMWGTDSWERFVGQAEADREFPKWIAGCPPWTAITPDHRAVFANDDFACVADDVTGRYVIDGVSGISHYRVTMVWQRFAAWKLVHVHMSNAD